MIEKCGIGGINNMKEYTCEVCGKEFDYKHLYENHFYYSCPRGGYEHLKVLKRKNNIKPNHYNKGKKDLIEMWYQTMPLEQFRGAMKSNIIKYTMRYENKNQLEDLNKALEYLKRLKVYEEKTLG